MDHYKQLNNECCEAIGNRMQGVVRRNGLMAFRIMMVLTIVRHLTDDCYYPMPEGQPLRLECSDEDYHTSLTIAETMLYHSAYMFRQLDKPSAPALVFNRNDRREILYNMLPESFTKQEYLTVVRRLEYSESTCNKWIDRYIAENRLRHCGHSKYEKVQRAPSAPPFLQQLRHNSIVHSVSLLLYRLCKSPKLNKDFLPESKKVP